MTVGAAVFDGAGGGGGGVGTIAFAEAVGAAQPQTLHAATVARIVWPTSAAVVAYWGELAPPMSAPLRVH